MSIHDAYGYGAMVGVAGYYLFPDLAGNPTEEDLRNSIEASRTVLTEMMKIRGDSPWIAGDSPSLADFYLAPICFYVSLVEDASKVFDVPGFGDWWERVQQLESYRATEPDLG